MALRHRGLFGDAARLTARRDGLPSAMLQRGNAVINGKASGSVLFQASGIQMSPSEAS
jgi:hypothetical protein